MKTNETVGKQLPQKVICKWCNTEAIIKYNKPFYTKHCSDKSCRSIGFGVMSEEYMEEHVEKEATVKINKGKNGMRIGKS